MPIPRARRRELTDDEFAGMVNQELVCPHISTERYDVTHSWKGQSNQRFWVHKTDRTKGCDEKSRVEIGEFLGRLHSHHPGIRLVCDEGNRTWINVAWAKGAWAEFRRIRGLQLEDDRIRMTSTAEWQDSDQ